MYRLFQTALETLDKPKRDIKGFLLNKNLQRAKALNDAFFYSEL